MATMAWQPSPEGSRCCQRPFDWFEGPGPPDGRFYGFPRDFGSFLSKFHPRVVLYDKIVSHNCISESGVFLLDASRPLSSTSTFSINTPQSPSLWVCFQKVMVRSSLWLTCLDSTILTVWCTKTGRYVCGSLEFARFMSHFYQIHPQGLRVECVASLRGCASKLGVIIRDDPRFQTSTLTYLEISPQSPSLCVFFLTALSSCPDSTVLTAWGTGPGSIFIGSPHSIVQLTLLRINRSASSVPRLSAFGLNVSTTLKILRLREPGGHIVIFRSISFRAQRHNPLAIHLHSHLPFKNNLHLSHRGLICVCLIRCVPSGICWGWLRHSKYLVYLRVCVDWMCLVFVCYFGGCGLYQRKPALHA
jgi:hypothetical protein